MGTDTQFVDSTNPAERPARPTEFIKQIHETRGVIPTMRQPDVFDIVELVNRAVPEETRWGKYVPSDGYDTFKTTMHTEQGDIVSHYYGHAGAEFE